MRFEGNAGSGRAAGGGLGGGIDSPAEVVAVRAMGRYNERFDRTGAPSARITLAEESRPGSASASASTFGIDTKERD